MICDESTPAEPMNNDTLRVLVAALSLPLRAEYHKFRGQVARDLRFKDGHRRGGWIEPDDPRLLVPCMAKYAELYQESQNGPKKSGTADDRPGAAEHGGGTA